MTDLRTLGCLELGRMIETGRLDPRDLVREYLAAASGKGVEETGYVRLLERRALSEADDAANRARMGTRRSRLDGVPISWKDNFDTAGVPTEAGSRLLEGRTPDRDAIALARAGRAGLVALGKTAMTELAYSGLGYNPMKGTPVNPFDGRMPRLPGGSSAGAAVSVARGLAAAAIGTDTGGSVRIPAAWNGLVGFKTTAGLIPLDGVVPLSPTFDTIGPLTRTVADASALFSILAADTPIDLENTQQTSLTLLALANPFPVPVDESVEAAYEAALEGIERSGARVLRGTPAAVSKVRELGVGDLTAEIHSMWGARIESEPNQVFRRIAERVQGGAGLLASEIERTRRSLAELRRQYLNETSAVDAVLLPSVANPPPMIDEVANDADAYHKANVQSLALTTLANRLGLCATTLPVGQAGSPPMPVGLMVMAPGGQDRKLLRLAAALEPHLAR